MIAMLRQESALMQFSVYAYCVMPDHVHVLIYGLGATSNLLAFVKRLKQRTAHEFGKHLNGDLWQKKFYDRILRRDETVAAVAAYIWMNPVRKGMCEDPIYYPYCGSFVLDWKKQMRPSEDGRYKCKSQNNEMATTQIRHP